MPCPDDKPEVGCPVSGRLVRLTAEGERQAAPSSAEAAAESPARRLVPAVDHALDRRRPLRPRRGAVSRPAAKVRCSPAPTTASSATPAAIRRGPPASANSDPAGRRRRLAARPEPAAPERRNPAQRHAPADRPRHRRRAARQPDVYRARMRTPARIIGFGFRNPFRFAVDWQDGQRLRQQRRQRRRRGDRPRRHPAGNRLQLGLALLRRPAAEPGLLRDRAERLHPRSTTTPGSTAEPYFYYDHIGPGGARRSLPDLVGLGDLGPRPSTKARSSRAPSTTPSSSPTRSAAAST